MGGPFLNSFGRVARLWNYKSRRIKTRAAFALNGRTLIHLFWAGRFIAFFRCAQHGERVTALGVGRYKSGGPERRGAQ